MEENVPLEPAYSVLISDLGSIEGVWVGLPVGLETFSIFLTSLDLEYLRVCIYRTKRPFVKFKELAVESHK